MSLWIKAQDGLLTKANTIYIKAKNNYSASSNFLYVIFNDNVVLGTYRTPEQADEVVKEIEEAIINYEIFKIDPEDQLKKHTNFYRNFEKWDVDKKEAVREVAFYKMPKDKER